MSYFNAIKVSQNVIESVTNGSTTPLTAKGTYTFTIATATASTGDTYTNNGITYTVFAGIAGTTSVIMYGSGAPQVSGDLARVTGSGTNPIVFSAAAKTDVFIGVSASTLNVAGIQISLYTGTNCLVHVEQSPDGTHWDIHDELEYRSLAEPNFGVTVQAVSSYFRVEIENLNTISGTGAFRLQSILCPIVESLPRSLSDEGNLKVGIYEIEDGHNHKVKVTPVGGLLTSKTVRLVGQGFQGSVLDTNFWVSTVVANGSAVPAHKMLELKTNTTANGSSFLTSLRIARHITGSSNIFRGYVDFTTPVANNTKRWGVATAYNHNFTVTSASAIIGAIYTNNGNEFEVLATIASQTTLTTAGSGLPGASGTLTLISGTGDATITFSAATKLETPTDGFMFEISNLVYSVVAFRGSIANRVSNGSFNGHHGTTMELTSGFGPYDILYDNRVVQFWCHDELLHTLDHATTSLVNTISLPIRCGCFNTNNGAINTSLKIGSLGVLRYGEPTSRPLWKNQVNANTGPVILKRGPGTLQRICINSWTTGATCTVYDALTNTNPIAIVAPTAGNQSDLSGFTMNYDLDFYVGLSFTTTGTIDVTVIYE